MATTSVSNDKHLESISLIWLDPNNNISDNYGTKKNLRSIINHLKTFQDPQQCAQYIEKRSNEDQLLVVVYGQMDLEVIHIIHRFQQVSFIYICCNNMKCNTECTSLFPKVRP